MTDAMDGKITACFRILFRKILENTGDYHEELEE
jgi:hypothetical protein